MINAHNTLKKVSILEVEPFFQDLGLIFNEIKSFIYLYPLKCWKHLQAKF